MTTSVNMYIVPNFKLMIMKKILEVLQKAEGELKFNTDLDMQKDPLAIMDLTVNAMFSMATKLWGGNEQTVIAVIRSLFVADMAISTDRKVVLKGLGAESEKMGEQFMKMMKELQNQGKAMTFPPGMHNPSSKRKN